jgi:hypothetical protein
VNVEIFVRWAESCLFLWLRFWGMAEFPRMGLVSDNFVIIAKKFQSRAFFYHEICCIKSKIEMTISLSNLSLPDILLESIS